jgi:hypothetical protein
MPDAPDLETVITRLQDAEINCWVGTAPPAHIAAAVHDPDGGPDVREDFHKAGADWPTAAIADWLLVTAGRLYPGRLR